MQKNHLVSKAFVFIRFGLVGASGVFVNLLFFQTLIWFSSPVWLASFVGFCAGATSNYFLHRFWTFKKSGKAWKSISVATIVLAVTILVTTQAEQLLGLLPLFAQSLGIVIALPVNYVFHHYWVFKDTTNEN